MSSIVNTKAKYSKNDIDEIAAIVRASMTHAGVGFILSKKEMNDVVKFTRQGLKSIRIEE